MVSLKPMAGIAVGVAIAAVLLSAQAALSQDEARALDVWGYGLVVVAASALAWRRAAPVAALAKQLRLSFGWRLPIGTECGP